jgi:hypothetical protein
MTSQRLRAIALALTLGFITSTFAATPAQAETFAFASSPLTNLDPAGATINGGFTKFPTKAGLYIQQCIAPVGSARPATCSDTIQLWVTAAGGPGTTSPTGPITLKVASSITGKGVTVDCTTAQCGLFFRFDHTAPTDTSEDTFYPMTFAKGVAAAALAADEISVTLNGKPLVRNVPSNLEYREDVKIVATAKSGAAVTLTSLTPECTYSNGVFTALKGAGQCALAFSTVASATTAAASGNFPFILVPGTQKILKMPATLKKGSRKALPMETNFGAPISYTSTSKNCQVEGNLVELKKSGVCTMKASAPAKEGMWNELGTTIKLRVK